MSGGIASAAPGKVLPVDDDWQKVAALLLWKLEGRETVTITTADIEAMEAEFAQGEPVMLMQGNGENIELSIIPSDRAETLAAGARQPGGHA